MPLKACERLVAGEATKLGNHYRKTETIWVTKPITTFFEVVSFYYFETAICRVSKKRRTFYTTCGGWNTPSTNRAINSYRFLLEGAGYREVSSLEELAGYEDKNV